MGDPPSASEKAPPRLGAADWPAVKAALQAGARKRDVAARYGVGPAWLGEFVARHAARERSGRDAIAWDFWGENLPLR